MNSVAKMLKRRKNGSREIIFGLWTVTRLGVIFLPHTSAQRSHLCCCVLLKWQFRKLLAQDLLNLHEETEIIRTNLIVIRPESMSAF